MTNKWKMPTFTSRKDITTRISRVFFDSDLRCSHSGLAEIAKKAKCPPDDLKPGEFIFFMNTSCTAIKGFASGREALFHWKLEGDRKIPKDVLQYIPKYYGGEALPLNEALRELINKRGGK